MTLILHKYLSPVGELILGAHGGLLCMCDWVDSPKHAANLRRLCRELACDATFGDCAAINDAVAALDAYFKEGKAPARDGLLVIGTHFQQQVRRTIMDIPYGHTMSYSQLAESIGAPKAVRAVANAVATNPLSIFIPCHRVISGNGSPGGYAGGVSVKRYLLALER